MSGLEICVWVLVAVAEKYARWQKWMEDRDAGIGDFYVEAEYRANIVYWRGKALEEAKQEAT